MKSVWYMFDTFGEISRSFEYSTKKEAFLLQKVKEFSPESRRHKLVDVCKSHWIQCMVALELYVAIVATLQTIKTKKNKS